MNAASACSLSVTWQLAAVNVAVAVVLASALGLLAAWLLRRRPAPVQYGLLLGALALCLAAPGLSQLGRLSGLGRVQVKLPPPAPALVAEPLPVAMAVTPAAVPAMDRRPPAAAAAAKPRVVFSWALAGGVVLAIWALGILAALGRLALGAALVWRLRRSSRATGGDALRAAAERARQVLGLRAAPRLGESPLTPTPLVVGLFRPMILLPSGLAARLEAGQLEAVLLHETAHIAQRDPLVGLAQRLAAALFWWCPLVHKVNRRLDELREDICDNYVIQTQGDGFRLARVLVDLAEQAQAARWLRLVGAMAVTEPGGRGLEARVRRLLQGNRNTVTRLNLAALCGTAAFSLLVGCAMMTTAVRTEEGNKAEAAAAPRVMVTKVSAGYTVATSMNSAKITLPPGKWGAVTIESQDHLQCVFEAMVKPLGDEDVELSYRLSLAKTKGILEWQEHERRVPLEQWVKMQASAIPDDPAQQHRDRVTLVSGAGGTVAPLAKPQITREEGQPPVIVYPPSRTATEWVELKDASTRVAVDKGIEWQGMIAYLSLTRELVVADARTGKCLWSADVGAFWDTITFENVAKAGDPAEWTVVLKSAKNPAFQQGYALGTGKKLELKAAAAKPAGTAFTPRRSWSGSAGVGEQAISRLVTSAAEWTKLRGEIFGDQPDDIPTADDIAFATETLLVLYGGKMRNCSGMSAALAVEDDARFLIRVQEDCYQSLGETHPEHPYGLIVLPRRPGKPVVLEYNGQDFIGGPELWQEATRLPFAAATPGQRTPKPVAVAGAVPPEPAPAADREIQALFAKARALGSCREAVDIYLQLAREHAAHPLAAEALIAVAQYDLQQGRQLEVGGQEMYEIAGGLAKGAPSQAVERIRLQATQTLLEAQRKYGEAADIFSRVAREYPASPVAAAASRGAADAGQSLHEFYAKIDDHPAYQAFGQVFSQQTSRIRADAAALLRQAKELREVANWSRSLNREPPPLQEVMAGYQKVVDRYPHTATARQARLEIADLQWELGDKEQARKAYQEIADGLPNTPEGGAAFGRLVDGLFEKGDLAKALEKVETYVADPKAPARDGMLLKGSLAAMNLKDLAKARALAEQLLTEHPESQLANKTRLILSRIYEKLNLPAAALPPVPAKPPAAAAALAAAKEFLKNKDNARAAIQLQALASARDGQDPDIGAEAQYLMGEIYREAGVTKSAYRCYKVLTWDYPESPWAKLARERLTAKEFQALDVGDGGGEGNAKDVSKRREP